MAKGLRKPIATSTHTRAGTLCPSRAPAATASYCRRGGVSNRRGRERGGRVKSRRREGIRLGRRVRPRQHDGGVVPGVTRNARGASGRTWSRGRGGAVGNPSTPSSPPGGPISFASTAAVASAAATTAREETCAGPGGFRRAPHTAKRTHEVPVAGLHHGCVLRGYPLGVCHEGRRSQEDHEEECRGNRTSSRFTTGRASGEGTRVARGAREAWCGNGLKILSYPDGT